MAHGTGTKYFYMLEIPKVDGYALRNGQDFVKMFGIQSFTLNIARDMGVGAQEVHFMISAQGDREDAETKRQTAFLNVMNLVYGKRLDAKDVVKVNAYIDDPDQQKSELAWTMTFDRVNFTMCQDNGNGAALGIGFSYEGIHLKWKDKSYDHTYVTTVK
jgi:hypothetical protein